MYYQFVRVGHSARSTNLRMLFESASSKPYSLCNFKSCLRAVLG